MGRAQERRRGEKEEQEKNGKEGSTGEDRKAVRKCMKREQKRIREGDKGDAEDEMSEGGDEKQRWSRGR